MLSFFFIFINLISFADKNIQGSKLELCSLKPLTGFYRDGFCRTGVNDTGTHVVCVKVSSEFLAFSKSKGNDLVTANPRFNFPGLKAGDNWCVCALRWLEAKKHGKEPPVIPLSTHERFKNYFSYPSSK